MLVKFPKDDKYFSWTRHIKNKMIFYGLSEQKIKTVLKSSNRREEGIAPNTTAVMKRNDTRKRKEEIWVMYQQLTNNKQQITNNKQRSYQLKVISYKLGAKLRLISAWRYPGISKPGKKIPIPEDILAELDKIL